MCEGQSPLVIVSTTSVGSYCVALACQNKAILWILQFYQGRIQAKKWVAAVQREGWQATEYSRICGAHLVTGMVEIQFSAGLSFSK